MQKQYDDPNEEDKIVCRILIPTRLAGAIIGKGGETVNEMRMAHDCEISIPTSTTPERTVRVMAAEHKSVIDCMRQILDVIGEELRRAGRIVDETMSEIRLLMHDSHAGYVIGQGGKNIKQLRIDTDCRIILNTEHAPFSTDRVCQISGTKDSIVMALDRILVMIDETPIKGDKRRYNANYADDRIDYGGYRGSRRYFNHDGEGDNGGNRDGGRRDNYRDDREPRGPREPREPREPRDDRQNRSYYNNDRRDNERYGNERSFNQRNNERSFSQSNNRNNDNNNNYDQDNRDYGRSNNYSRTRDNFDNSYDRAPGNYHNSDRFGSQRNERYGNGDSYNNRSNNNNNGFGQARDNQNQNHQQQQQGSFFDRPQGGYNSNNNNNDRYGSNQQQQYDNNSRYNNNNKQQDRYASDNRFGNTWDNKQYSNTGNNSQGSNKDLQVNKNDNNDLNGNVKFTPRGVNDDGKENQDE